MYEFVSNVGRFLSDYTLTSLMAVAESAAIGLTVASAVIQFGNHEIITPLGTAVSVIGVPAIRSSYKIDIKTRFRYRR